MPERVVPARDSVAHGHFRAKHSTARGDFLYQKVTILAMPEVEIDGLSFHRLDVPRVALVFTI